MYRTVKLDILILKFTHVVFTNFAATIFRILCSSVLSNNSLLPTMYHQQQNNVASQCQTIA